jgi:hypothetical protein
MVMVAVSVTVPVAPLVSIVITMVVHGYPPKRKKILRDIS